MPAKKRPTPRKAPAAAERLAVTMLRELLDGSFESGALAEVIARHHDQASPALARALLASFLDALVALDDEELLARFVTFMILFQGREPFQEVLLETLDRPRHPAAYAWLVLLAELTGVQFRPFPDAPPPSPPLLASWLAALEEGEDGFYEVAHELLLVPAPLRPAFLEGLLPLLAARPNRLVFAGFLLLTPLGEPTHQLVRGWLERTGGPAGLALLARVDGEPLDAGFPDLPFDWPVLAAYATFPDGGGSQGLYLVRKRPGRGKNQAMVTAVVNDWRGLADGVGYPRMSKAEQAAMQAQVSQSLELVPVPPAYWRARLEEGLGLLQRLGLPSPHPFRLHRNLFVGLPEAPAPDLAALVTGWARPGQLARTAALLDQPFAASWQLLDAGPATHGFFEAALAIISPSTAGAAPRIQDLLAETALAPAQERALERLAATWLPAFFTPEQQRLWHGRLVQAAYLLDRQGRRPERDLAATAAQALASDGGVPLERQPLPLALVARSARYAVQDARADAFRALLPTASATVFQLKVTLAGARPPIWRRLLVPADLTLAELHDVLQAAMGWEDAHLHAFTVGGEEYGPADADMADERRVRLDRLGLDEGLTFLYTYDFGDDWQHRVTVEKRLPRDPAAVYPVCLKGKGACPPEDSGGVWGYQDMLVILARPGHPDHDEVATWMGEDFDPAAFDLAETNVRLAR